MQVVQTVNDTIRALYSPGLENLCLGDFLLVQEGKKRFLSQIVEITDDIDEKSQNVAEIKLLFSVSENDEVLPYDNHTPSKECKILHTRQKDIEDFVNIDKKTFELATNPKTGLPLDFNVDFFENRPVIFADKIEQSNVLFANLAKKLSEFKKTVVFDYTGSLEIEGAKRLCAVLDFKLPLNALTLDAIWAKGLEGASLETQAVCEEIFNEVKDFIKESKEGYLSFSRFVKVIEAQYAQTPIKELLVLKNRLIKYQHSGLFAGSKKEFEAVSKPKNKVTIVDLSRLRTEWYKDFSTFVLDGIKENSFVLLRLSDINSDVDFIKELYERDLCPIPSISYSFKRMPTVVEYCPNYVLLQTLNPKRDFGYVNGALDSLSPEHAILWGVDTKNFIFTVKNELHIKEEAEKEVKKPVKMKFSPFEEVLDVNIDEVKVEDVELKEFLELKKETREEPQEEPEEEPQNEPVSEYSQEPKEEPQEAYQPVYEFVESSVYESHEEILKAQSPLSESVSIDDVEEFEPVAEQQPLISEEELDFFDALKGEPQEELKEEPEEEPEEELEEEPAPQPIFQLDEKPSALIIEEEPKQDVCEQEEEILHRQQYEEEAQEVEQGEVAHLEQASKEAPKAESYVESYEDEEYEEDVEELQPKTQVHSFIEEIDEQEPLSDVVEISEVKQEEGETLKELVEESVEASFDELMEDESILRPKENKIVINENVSIDLSTIKDKLPKDDSDLPVFPSEPVSQEVVESFQEGDDVEHDKYGLGKVAKVVKYANRCLLQIEFSEVGKRLLDPRIAHLRKP